MVGQVVGKIGIFGELTIFFNVKNVKKGKICPVKFQQQKLL